MILVCTFAQYEEIVDGVKGEKRSVPIRINLDKVTAYQPNTDEDKEANPTMIGVVGGDWIAVEQSIEQIDYAIGQWLNRRNNEMIKLQ